MNVDNTAACRAYISKFLFEVFPELEATPLTRTREALTERIWQRADFSAGGGELVYPEQYIACVCGGFVEELLKMRNNYLHGTGIEDRIEAGRTLDNLRAEQLRLQIEETKLRIARMTEKR